VQEIAGLSSLEDTFSHFAEERNAEDTVAGIIGAMRA
jgi:hypothetical protein